MTEQRAAPYPDTHAPEVASAGYRAARWLEARRVLANQRAKGRLPEFFTHWLPASPPAEAFTDPLVFVQSGEDLLWHHGGLVDSALDRALLHVPALRRFWTQELRQAHFDALRRSVPPAWFLDDAPVPHGAVIAGLEIARWADFSRKHDAQHFELRDEKNTAHAFEAEKLPQLATQRRFVLAAKTPAGLSLTAHYARTADGRISLVDYQGMS